ncbi:MAG: hypothetical protein ABI402_13080 [Ferruginibacter sp.]
MNFLFKKNGSSINRMIISLCTTIFILTGCYNDKEDILYPGSNNPTDCATVPSKFATDIYPLITSKCAISGCHDATASGGVILQNYTQVNSKTDRINARAVMEKSMPPTGALLPDEISKIKCWISSGALNN